MSIEPASSPLTTSPTARSNGVPSNSAPLFRQQDRNGRIHVLVRTARTSRRVALATVPRWPSIGFFRCSMRVMARYGRTLFDKRMMAGELESCDVGLTRPGPRRRMGGFTVQDSPSAQRRPVASRAA